MSNDIILNFGKHTGKKLSEIPRDYVVWLAGQDIRKQPEAAKVAQAFLDEHPVMESGSQDLYPRPLSYKEARKLGWMAGKRNRKARATMLEARDQNNLLCILEEDAEYEEDDYRLLYIRDDGTCTDASFYDESYAEVEVIANRYPQFGHWAEILEDVAEREKMEADEKRRTLTLTSKNGNHELRLCIWSVDEIEVSIDGRDSQRYRYRLPNDKERNDPKWKVAAAVLEHEYAAEGTENIGLLPERKALVEQKIAEIATEQGK